MYGETKKDLVEIIRKLCEMKQVQLVDGKVCSDHIHMYVAIPPEYRTKWVDRHFWARGYYVASIGNVNEETVRKHIQEQKENDKLEDGRK